MGNFTVHSTVWVVSEFYTNHQYYVGKSTQLYSASTMTELGTNCTDDQC